MEFFLYHLTFAGISLLLAQSLNLIWRFDRFSLGHQGFFALGAYSGAILARLWIASVGSSRFAGLAFLVASMVFACAVSTLVAWFLARSLERAQGDAFAVATLIFAEIIRLAVTNTSFVGGGLGFEVPYLVFDNSKDERFAYVALYASLVSVLCMALYWGLRRLDGSVYALYANAVRDDSLAAELSGVDVQRRLQGRVFALGCGVAGMTGAVFLHFTTLIVPADFSFLNSLPIVLSVVLGRLDTRRCTVMTLALYAGLETIKLRFFGLFGPEVGSRIAEWRDAQIGLLLVLSVTGPLLWRRLRGHRGPAGQKVAT